MSECREAGRRGGQYDCTKRMVVEGIKRGRGKEDRKERGRRRCSAAASGVVEILQQRASPLLSDVHLILQILDKQNNKTRLLWLLCWQRF